MIREIFEDMPFLSCMLIFFILLTAFILTDGIGSKPEAFSGHVVDKHYKPESVTTGTGLLSNSNGGAGVISTVEVDSEAYLIMVRTEQGKIVTVKCEPELFYRKEKNSLIECEAYRGLFTGLIWISKGVR